MLRRIGRAVILGTVIGSVLMGCEKGSVSPEVLAQRAVQAIENKNYQAAVIDLRTALQHDPQNARVRWLLGELYLTMENGPSAEKELQKALELGVLEISVLPLLARALLLQAKVDKVLALPRDKLSGTSAGELAASRALAFVGKGEKPEARREVDLALSLAPNSLHALYAQARVLVADERPDEALAVLDSIRQLFPEYAASWTLRGDILAKRRDFSLAEQAYTKAIENRVSPLQDRMKRGFARLAQGKVDEASADAAVLTKQAPDSSQAQYLAGLIYLEKQELSAAKDALERAYQRSPNNPPIVFALASVDMALGNVNRARDLAEKALAMAPSDIPGSKLMAQLHLRDREGARAEILLRSVLQSQPDDKEAQRLLANSLYLQSKVDEASGLSREIAGQMQDSPVAQAEAGIGLMAAGATAEGLVALERAVELAPEDRALRALLIAGLIEKRSKAEAVAAAEKFVQVKPDDPEAFNLLAVTHLANNDLTQAKVAFSKVVQLDPANRAAARTLASLALSHRDPATARAHLGPALKAYPADTRLLLLQADAARQEGRLGEMEVILQQAIDADPLNVTPRVRMARRLLDKNEPDKALTMLMTVESRRNADVLLVKADAFYQLERFEDARRALEDLVQIAPNVPQVHFELARLHDTLENQEGVARELDRVLELSPDNTRAKLIRSRLLAMEGRISEAKQLVDEVDLPANDPRVLTARFTVASHAQRSEEAIIYGQRLYTAQPTARNTVMLSRAYTAAGQVDRSIETLESWLATHPQDVPVITELAKIYQKQQRLDQYLVQLHRILEADSHNVFALNNLAWYLRKESSAEALDYARRAYEQDPASPSIIDTYALVLAENKEFDSALRMITKAIDLAREPETYQIRRDEIRLMAGDKDTSFTTSAEIRIPSTEQVAE